MNKKILYSLDQKSTRQCMPEWIHKPICFSKKPLSFCANIILVTAKHVGVPCERVIQNDN